MEEEEEEDEVPAYLRERPKFNWSNSKFMSAQLFYQFGIPSDFCVNCWPLMEGGKNGTHEIKKVSSNPHVTLYMTPAPELNGNSNIKTWYE